MGKFSEDTIQRIWNKATIVEGYDPDKCRKDYCGAWIRWDDYGSRDDFSWEIEHIYPESKGGDADEINLRPMHWLNNNIKSDDYPAHKVAVIAQNDVNVNAENLSTIVPKDLQSLLKKKYNIK